MSHIRPHMLGLLAMLVAGAGLDAALAAGASDAEIALKPVAAKTPPGLAVALFAPDTTLKSPLETLAPVQSWPVTSLGLTLNANTGLCADHTIESILALPNQENGQANADGPDCIFGMLLVIEGGPKRFEVATECGDWVDDAATCWGYGQAGEFRIQREHAKAGAGGVRLVFPGPPKPVSKEAAGEAAEPSAQKYGLFLDTLLDDNKQAKGDLWLTWTGGTVEVGYTR